MPHDNSTHMYKGKYHNYGTQDELEQRLNGLRVHLEKAAPALGKLGVRLVSHGALYCLGI